MHIALTVSMNQFVPDISVRLSDILAGPDLSSCMVIPDKKIKKKGGIEEWRNAAVS